MICSPTATDREYLLPIQEDGTILIPTHVEYDGVTYTVSTIEEGTFINEPRLLSISLPNTITAIGRDNFSECTNLNTLDLSQVTISSPLEVTDCPALRHLILPETQNETMFESFLGTYELESLRLPENIGASTSFIMCLSFISSLQTIYSLSPTPPRFDSGIDGLPDNSVRTNGGCCSATPHSGPISRSYMSRRDVSKNTRQVPAGTATTTSGNMIIPAKKLWLTTRSKTPL